MLCMAFDPLRQLIKHEQSAATASMRRGLRLSGTHPPVIKCGIRRSTIWIGPRQVLETRVDRSVYIHSAVDVVATASG